MSNPSLSSVMKTLPVDIEIKFGTSNQRVRGTWVGQREGEYLIIEFPRKYNWSELQDWFNNSIGLVMRGVLDHGQVYAATGRVLGTTSRPYRTLYMSYPDTFEERSLRKVPRVEVELDASLCFTDEVAKPIGLDPDFKALTGRVTDLSKTGIAFETTMTLPCPQSSLMNQLIELSIKDEGKELVNVLSEVRSCRLLGEKRALIGLALDKRNREYQNSLSTLILHSKTIKSVWKEDK
ncbi:hypothetical protein CWE09_10650 [Aliidiomarina minuta]|uniref:PilZ domain-containing protein n=1 Tax=Aliidiomarina minuta TaxID=880057 RepID=A0A432W4J6_9GAMM|nr:PilZ domain-containing protein [Aliidiomarina minuta]RUO24327.1 hypothetical protein CWE09_10650 [Aliidiomarina minuta]